MIEEWEEDPLLPLKKKKVISNEVGMEKSVQRLEEEKRTHLVL